MRARFSILGIIAIIIIGLFLSLYTVMQTQSAILLRLGKIETTAAGQAIVKAPGLHIKLPLIETVKRFDMRLRTLNIDSSRIMTIEQKEVLVDAFVKWRIANVVQYYKATSGSAVRANLLLKQQVNASMRAAFGSKTIGQLLSSERETVMQNILASAQKAAKPLGVDVVDVRIKRIDLPTEVAETVYSRMRSAREKKAAKIRATGQEQAEIIRSKADAKVTVILATAKKHSAQIMAKGNGQAAQIYANTYKANPQFYRFYRSLEAYVSVFGHEDNTLVVKPNSAFFHYFNQLPNAVKIPSSA